MESPLYTDLTPQNVPDDLEIIETFGLIAARGPLRLERHIGRMCLTARKLGFDFAPSEAREMATDLPLDADLRCRFSLTRQGLRLSNAPAGPRIERWKVAIAAERLDETDPWRRVKTSVRRQYNQARAGMPEGIDELIFLNSRGEVAECTITNVFVRGADNVLRTPPVSSGALPGVLRAELLAERNARVARLTADDLTAGRIYCGNSLRGLIAAELVTLPG